MTDAVAETNPTSAGVHPPERPSIGHEMRTSEDWWAIWCAVFLLAISFSAVWLARPADLASRIANGEEVEVVSPLASWIAKPGKWTLSPAEAFSSCLPGLLGVFCLISALFAVAMAVRGKPVGAFLKAFPVVFLLATLAYTLAGQSVIKAYNLGVCAVGLAGGLDYQ